MEPENDRRRLTWLGTALGIPSHRSWEAIGLRLLFGWLVFTTLPVDSVGSGPIFGSGGWLGPAGRVEYSTQPFETGFAKFFDVTFMGEAALQPWLYGISAICLVAYFWGRGLAIALPILLVISVAGRTLENSQGFIFHKYQIVSTVLLMQAVVAVAYSYLRLRKGTGGRPGLKPLDHYLIRYSQIGIVAVYVLAGIAKIDRSGGDWVKNSPYFGLDLVRTHRQEFYGRLEGERYKEIASASRMLERPMESRLKMGVGLVLEIFAFVALLHRGAALVVGLMIIAFHMQVESLMKLSFPLNEQIVWIYLVNPVFWIGVLGIGLWSRAQGSRGPKQTT